MVSKSKLLRYLWVAVFAGVAVFFGVYVYQIVKLLTSGISLPLEYGDGWNMYVASWWGNGGLSHIYSPRGEIPYVNMPYTPLYYLLVGVFYPLTGPNFWVGRVISLAAGFGCSILFYFILKKLTSSKWWGLVGAVLFFMPPVVRGWTFWFKTEPMALFFSILGLYLVVKFNGTRKVLWSVIPVLLAIFTKQTFASAAVAVGIYLLITNWKLALQYAGLIITGGLIGVGLCQWLSGGTFISNVLVGPSMVPKYWMLSLYIMELVIVKQWIIITLALGAILLLVRKKEFRTLPILFAIYFLIATAVCTAVSSKSGGWLPYSIEMMPAAVILVVIFAWRVSKLEIPIKKNFGIFVEEKKYSLGLSSSDGLKMFIPILLLSQLFSLPSYYSWGVNTVTTEEYKIVLDYISEVPKDTPIMSEYEELMIWSGREPVAEPSFFSQCVRKGVLDVTPILNMVKNKELGLIIQEWDINTYWDPVIGTFPNWVPQKVKDNYNMGVLRSTDELAEAIRDNYQFKDHVGRFWIYEPKVS